MSDECRVTRGILDLIGFGLEDHLPAGAGRYAMLMELLRQGTAYNFLTSQRRALNPGKPEIGSR